MYPGRVRVLVAPDKFKGTLTAPQAAEAIARGWARADPSARVEKAPMADGGEGTLDALVAALGGERRRLRVSGPLGDPVEAEFAVVSAPEGSTGVVEMARASGLDLISPGRRDPLRTTTRGTGELILAVCRAGVRRVLVCVGGSATNDAGAGMAQALGIRLLDESGRDLQPGGAALAALARIDLSELDPVVEASTFVVATDVDNPLVGPEGASAVYGPQKGASAEDVALLDRALGHFAAVVYRDLGLDVRGTKGAGAAGGLGAGQAMPWMQRRKGRAASAGRSRRDGEAADEAARGAQERVAAGVGGEPGPLLPGSPRPRCRCRTRSPHTPGSNRARCVA